MRSSLAKGRTSVSVFRWLLVAASCTGCVVILGIDEDYRPRGSSGTGGASSSGAGGSPLSGGSGGSVPTGGTAGVGGADMCPSGQKRCQDMCVEPAPIIGCSLDGCDPCLNHPPENANVACKAGQCAWKCIEGYNHSGAGCVLAPTGGSGGDSGSAGSSASGGTDAGAAECNRTDCPDGTVCGACTKGCGFVGPAGCCLADGRCGGMWFGLCLSCSP